MGEREISEELDAAFEALMQGADTTDISPEVARLLQLAGHLRGMPSPNFKQRLKNDLLAGVAPRTVTAANMNETIDLALAELARAPRLQPHNLNHALKDMPDLGMRFLETLDNRTVGVSRFSGDSHWERHPAADELLYLIEGEAEVTTLTPSGPVVSSFPAGSVFVCPRGRWHRVQPKGEVQLLFATPGEGTSGSADAYSEPPSEVDATPLDPSRLVAHNVRAALRSVPVLDITAASTAADADAAFVEIARLDACPLYAGRFRGLAPWERHDAGDELLYVLDGEVDITVLTDEGCVERTLSQGSIFVCPRGLWHRQRARGFTTMLSGTPGHSAVSWAEDPRVES